MEKEIKRIQGKEFYNYKRRRGDRKDGWRVRSDDPFFGIIPHIMPQRTGSTVMYDANIDVKTLDEFVRYQRRNSDMKDLSRLMVMCAALVRVFSQYPNLNRFIRGNRIWARNYLSVSVIIKKDMVLGGEECAIKPRFEPNSNLHDVWAAFHEEIAISKEHDGDGNSTARIARIVNALPVWMVRSFVNLVRFCDERNRLTNFLNDVSPFHTSMFITDIGSTGISSVYHHLYDFGTCSHFISLGKREKEVVMSDDNPKEINTLHFRYVVDERIVDGFYYAKAMRYFEHLIKHPQELLERPEGVVEDALK